MRRYTVISEHGFTGVGSRYGVIQDVIDTPDELYRLFDKLGEYEDLEEKIQSHYKSEDATLHQLVDIFISTVESLDKETYKGFRILTNENAVLYDEWKAAKGEFKAFIDSL